MLLCMFSMTWGWLCRGYCVCTTVFSWVSWACMNTCVCVGDFQWVCASERESVQEQWRMWLWVGFSKERLNIENTVCVFMLCVGVCQWVSVCVRKGERECCLQLLIISNCCIKPTLTIVTPKLLCLCVVLPLRRFCSHGNCCMETWT